LAADEGNQLKPVIVVGHDWGSYIAQRVLIWYPEIVKALCIACVPWTPCTGGQRMDIKEVVKHLPNFTYQIQFASGEVDKRVAELGEKGLRNFVLFGAGGSTEDGKPIFDPRKGLDLEALGGKVIPRLYTDQAELDYVFQEYKRNGAHPPLNAYRVMPLNARDEKDLPKSSETKIPTTTLFIQALRDKALPPAMSQDMERFFADGVLSRKSINADHFVQLEKPDEFNAALKDWIEEVVEKGQKSSL
jgi:pimeloyl-ACP methyl ester carboxylesterase